MSGFEKISARDLHLSIRDRHVLKGVDLNVVDGRITAILGSPQAGKSALLRTFNRMNDFIPDHRFTGTVLLDGKDIYAKTFDPIALRRRVGMVFWRRTPYAPDIFEELARRLEAGGVKKEKEKAQRIEKCLKETGLWDELKSKPSINTRDLNEVQARKLSVARAILNDPEVILLDNPFEGLEDNQAEQIRMLIKDMTRKYTIVMATRSENAARTADFTAVMEDGRITCFGTSSDVLSDR